MTRLLRLSTNCEWFGSLRPRSGNQLTTSLYEFTNLLFDKIRLQVIKMQYPVICAQIGDEDLSRKIPFRCMG